MNRAIGMAAAGALALAAAGCETAPKREDLVTGETSCGPLRFEVYFREGQASLTEAAAAAVDLTARRLQGCDIRRVQVLGLADATGAAEANLTLSQQRARATAEALMAAGFPAPAFDVAAAGDAGATTASGAQAPLRRRTEILIDARPR